MNSLLSQGVVKSASECQPISGVEVTALNENREVVGVATTDDAGRWTLAGTEGVRWMQFHKNGFTTKELVYQDIGPCVRLLENRIVGYLDKLWFYPEETAHFHSHSPTPYRARLFRHGLQKELIADLGEKPAQLRQVPDLPWVADGLPWTPSWEYTIPKDLRPGLYSLALETVDQTFAVPLVVATPPSRRGQRTSLAVLASTPTWQAYNFYGGRSKYHCWEESVTPSNYFVPSWKYHAKQRIKDLIPASLRHRLRRGMCPPTPAWQLHPLSVRRPFTHSGLEVDDPGTPFTHHLAGAEWRLLAWLEREGIEYDFIAGEELHACPDLLSNYQAVVLNTHFEYVSKDMYAGLHRFHTEQNGWLLNLSGNSLYCEVELTEDALCFKGGLFMDTCADETQLLGVRFTRNDIGSCAPYRIVKPKHWAFTGIGLPPDRCFGRFSLNQDTPRVSQEMDPSRPGDTAGLVGHGASGWETDKLSHTAPADMVVIAKGMNQFGGADMVVREPAYGRGGMFSASSVLFSGCLLVDVVASHLVKNVLDRALQGRVGRTVAQNPYMPSARRSVAATN